MKKPAAWRAYAEKKDLDRLAKMRAKIDAMVAAVEGPRATYAKEFDRVKNYSIQRLRRKAMSKGEK